MILEKEKEKYFVISIGKKLYLKKYIMINKVQVIQQYIMKWEVPIPREKGIRRW
jgi:hypothetical protein